jgi:hypothetical protein
MYSLGQHMPSYAGKDGNMIRFASGQLELLLPGNDSDLTTDGHDSYTLSRQAVEALDKLRTILTSSKLKDLPLSVDTLVGISPELRYTSLYPPRSHPFVRGDKASLKSVAGKYS